MILYKQIIKQILYRTLYRTLWVFLLAGLILVSFSMADRDRYDDDDYYEYDDDDDYYKGRRGYDRDDDDDYRGRRGYDRYDDDDYYEYDDDDYRGRRNRRSRQDRDFNLSMLDSLDRNGDNKITRKEGEDLGKKIFSDYDSDNSGSVSEEEFFNRNRDLAQKSAELRYNNLSKDRIERIRRRSQNSFKRLDQNKDNQVDIDELYMRRLDRLFERFDRDGDGVIEERGIRRRR